MLPVHVLPLAGKEKHLIVNHQLILTPPRPQQGSGGVASAKTAPLFCQRKVATIGESVKEWPLMQVLQFCQGEGGRFWAQLIMIVGNNRQEIVFPLMVKMMILMKTSVAKKTGCLLQGW